MIVKQRLLAEFIELCRIYSPSRKERVLADLLKSRLADLGCAVSEDAAAIALGGESGNIFARLQGNRPEAPALMLSAHLDCVEPCLGIEPIIENERIISAGPTILGADCRAGLAPILEGLRCALESGVARGDILVVFTVAEEDGVAGAKHLDRSRLAADFGFALDTCGAPGKIVTRAPGKNQLEIRLKGRKAHAGMAPEQGVNAIMVAARALAGLKMGRLDFETTANVGSLRADGATNVVPDAAELSLEVRSQDSAKLTEETRRIVARFAEQAATDGAGLEIEKRCAYEPYTLGPDSPQVRLAEQAMRAIGITPCCEPTGGGSDANFFNAYGLPTAVLSCGMQKAHTTEEYIEVEHLCLTAELVLSLITCAGELTRKNL